MAATRAIPPHLTKYPIRVCDTPYNVLLYYCFTRIDDPESFAASHRELCESLQLRGRILIATEGINGTVSGTEISCREYMAALQSDPQFEGIEFKIDEATEHAFKALYVRIRPEIITIGRTLNRDVSSGAGVHLSPAEWKSMMAQQDVLILDGRNAYESELGRFCNAICPPVRNFREIPEWIEANRELFAGKKVLTYCTGGIRCEKLSAWMLEAGFENVYQLHGGIAMYAKDPATQGEGFEGVNVVFDERVAVSAGERSEIVTKCRNCGCISANYVNCSNVACNLRMILCPDCEASTGLSCSTECATAPRRRLKGKKWHESSPVWSERSRNTPRERV